MTPTELRALDLFIAEKVMGRKRVKPACLVDGTFALIGEDCIISDQDKCAHYFQPTESPADAMMVLKKLMEKCWILLGKTADGYWAQEHEAGTEGKGPTIEMAICLLAKEVCQ